MGGSNLTSVSQCCQFLLKRMFDSCAHEDRHIPGVYEEDTDNLANLVDRCVSFGESNSILVVGPRGCGKSHLVETAIKRVEKEKKDQAVVVRLSGLLQTDDNIALEEMTRQLKLENVADGLVFGSFEEKLQFLLQSLKTGTKESQPAVFVIDEFDLFANHKNQTLLYNLFDICQTRQTPICVIGVTCRLDVTELLEKRVKSRFSHRFIYMFKQQAFSSLMDIFKSYLQIPSSHHIKKGGIAAKWNKSIEEQLVNPQIKDALLFRFNIVTDVHSIQNLAALIMANISQEESLPQQKAFLEAFKILDVDSKAAMLQGTSVLELTLIIAMKQLNEIYSDEPFNFQMVYEHYRKFCERKSSMKVCQKALAMKAFEHLIDLEIVAHADNSTSMLKQYRPMRLHLTNQEVEDALLHYTGLPSDIKQWSYSDCVSHSNN